MIELEDWVWGDDSTSRKVDSLAHEVSSHTALLALEARSDVFDRSAASVLLFGRISDIVVHESGDEKLESLDLLLPRASRSTSSLHHCPQLVICPDNLKVGVREIVFASLGVPGLDRGPNRWRAHREHFDDHPLWPGTALSPVLRILPRVHAQ